MKFVAPEATKYLGFFPTSRAGWSGKSLRERAKAVKMDLEYDELYYFFCGVKHTLPMGAVGFVFEQGDFVAVIRGPNIKGVYLAALYSTRYLLKLCDLLQDAYGLTVQEDSLQHLMLDLFRESEAVHQVHPELCV